jgi:hypothetical protein
MICIMDFGELRDQDVVHVLGHVAGNAMPVGSRRQARMARQMVSMWGRNEESASKWTRLGLGYG